MLLARIGCIDCDVWWVISIIDMVGVLGLKLDQQSMGM